MSARRGPRTGPTTAATAKGSTQPSSDASFRRITRNYTEAFVARRALFRDDTKRRMAHIAARKAKLAFDKRAEMEEKKKQSSWRTSLGWNKPADEAILPTVDEGAADAPSCRLCGASFRALVRKRYKCPLCELYVCGSCFNQKIQLDPVIFTDQPKWICKACNALVQEEEERATIAKAIETASEQPLVFYHNVVMEVVRTLSRHLPRYEASVQSADSVADCQEAGKLEAALVELFKNFDIGVKKITAIKFEDEKSLRVQASVKMALVGFLQDNLSRFRTLQNQRKSLLAQFTEEEKSGKRKQRKPRQNDVEGTGPFIATIDPAMSPMAGTKLTVTGSNFKSATKVSIAGVPCRMKFMGPDRLIVYSPPLDSEGLKDVQVINPTGESHKLDAVLLYSDEYFKLAEASHQKTEGNEKSKNRILNGESNTIARGALAIDDVVDNSKVPLEEPVIRLIHPAICPIGGGTTLRLIGLHFCSQSVVRIGGKEAPIVKFSDLSRSESCSQQLEVQSPKLAHVGFHTVEVLNPGGKRCRLDDVLYYTDDPALLSHNDDSSSSSSTPAKSGLSSSSSSLLSSATARRVSGFFSRSSSPASAALSSVEKEKNDSHSSAPEPTPSNPNKPFAISSMESSSLPVLRSTSDGINAGSNVELTGLPRLERSSTSLVRPRPPSNSMATLGATNLNDEDDLWSSEDSARTTVGVSRRPHAVSGHTRSVSLDQSAFVGRIPSPDSPAAYIQASRGSAVDLGSGGYFWNVIDSDSSTTRTTPTSLSTSSSSVFSTSSSSVAPSSSRRLRWGGPS